MNKRIRINGQLFEAVSSSRNLQESYGKKVDSEFLYRNNGLVCDDMPWGPCLLWEKDDIAVSLAADEGSRGRLEPAIEIDNKVTEGYFITDDFVYSGDKKGYREAVRDFNRICELLDKDTPMETVARKFHML